jgi:hypothetical protein
MVTGSETLIPIAVAGAGLAVLLVALLLTTAWRLPDVTLRKLLWSGSDIGAHPEHYVLPQHLGVIRLLNLCGVILWTLGVLMIVALSLRRLL